MPLTEASLVADENLWRAFREAPSQALRDNLVQRYGELARMHAAMLYAERQVPEIEFDEFHHYALVGLLEAVDRYDPGRGASFATFASYRIRGAILNGIEKHCEKQQQIALRSRLREERFKHLLEEVTGENEDPFLRLVDLAIGTAIGFMLDDSGMYQGEEGTYEHNIYRSREVQDLARLLEAVVAALPAVEQTVICGHYLQHLRFDDIAANMGLSKGRISQLHHRALRRMRDRFDQLQLHRTDF